MDYLNFTPFGGQLLSPASSQIIVTPFKRTWLSRESLALVYGNDGGTGADMVMISGKRVRLRDTVPINNEPALSEMYLQLRQEQVSAEVRLPIASKASLIASVKSAKLNSNKVASYVNLLSQPGLTQAERTSMITFLNTYTSGAVSFYPEAITTSLATAFILTSVRLTFYPNINSMDASLTLLSAPL